MDQYLLIPFLMGWTSIYQLFWCSPGVQGFDPLPCGCGCGFSPEASNTGITQQAGFWTMPYRAGIVFRDFREKKPFEKMFGWVNPWDQRPQWIGLTPNGLLIFPNGPEGLWSTSWKAEVVLRKPLDSNARDPCCTKRLVFFWSFSLNQH